jgi:hypothetical protein
MNITINITGTRADFDIYNGETGEWVTVASEEFGNEEVEVKLSHDPTDTDTRKVKHLREEHQREEVDAIARDYAERMGWDIDHVSHD